MLPTTINPDLPSDDDSLSGGAKEIRDLKQLLVDLFGLEVDPEQILYAATTINPTTGELSIRRPPVKTITGVYTTTLDDETIVCDSALAFNLSILTAGSCPGKFYWIRNIGAGLVTLIGTIAGVVNPTLETNRDFYIYSDGTSLYGGKVAIQEAQIPPGVSLDFMGINVPLGYFWEDGSAKSRITYSTLFNVLTAEKTATIAASTFTNQTVTMTLATPTVISAASHGRSIGAAVAFETTGALYTGITAGTVYYIIAENFGANSFEISATPGGSAIATTGSQSGVHTLVDPGIVTCNDHGLQVHDKISFETTGTLFTELSIGTNYYVSATKFTTNSYAVCATPGGSSIQFTGSQSGIHTVRHNPHGCGNGTTTFNLPDTRRRVMVGAGGTAIGSLNTVIGATGGEETHQLTIAELASHNHQQLGPYQAIGGGVAGGGWSGMGPTGYTGGDAAHNNLQPSLVCTKIIKY